ncbi:hypothetical protein [Aquibaculum sediminis]|uniref:hypothetical protein n=1 Tax=Aquibaculum sediminis TaxID=3231907 RepID=UPI0034518682
MPFADAISALIRFGGGGTVDGLEATPGTVPERVQLDPLSSPPLFWSGRFLILGIRETQADTLGQNRLPSLLALDLADLDAAEARHPKARFITLIQLRGEGLQHAAREDTQLSITQRLAEIGMRLLHAFNKSFRLEHFHLGSLGAAGIIITHRDHSFSEQETWAVVPTL